jgi:hypothetical protein
MAYGSPVTIRIVVGREETSWIKHPPGLLKVTPFHSSYPILFYGNLFVSFACLCEILNRYGYHLLDRKFYLSAEALGTLPFRPRNLHCASVRIPGQTLSLTARMGGVSFASC